MALSARLDASSISLSKLGLSPRDQHSANIVWGSKTYNYLRNEYNKVDYINLFGYINHNKLYCGIPTLIIHVDTRYYIYLYSTVRSGLP